MLLKAINELLGDEVLASDGRVGTLENIYFDGDCWQACYLVVGVGTARVLVSVACVQVAAPARQRLTLSISRAQLGAGAGAWPMAAARWRNDVRICSVRRAAGRRIVAEDGPAGEVADLLLDPATWSIDYIVAAMTDGFGKSHVVLPRDWVEPLDPFEDVVHLRCTRAQLASAPRTSLSSPRPAKAKG